MVFLGTVLALEPIDLAVTLEFALLPTFLFGLGLYTVIRSLRQGDGLRPESITDVLASALASALIIGIIGLVGWKTGTNLFLGISVAVATLSGTIALLAFWFRDDTRLSRPTGQLFCAAAGVTVAASVTVLLGASGLVPFRHEEPAVIIPALLPIGSFFPIGGALANESRSARWWGLLSVITFLVALTLFIEAAEPTGELSGFLRVFNFTYTILAVLTGIPLALLSHRLVSRSGGT